jgi:hypothetical protein
VPNPQILALVEHFKFFSEKTDEKYYAFFRHFSKSR